MRSVQQAWEMLEMVESFFFFMNCFCFVESFWHPESLPVNLFLWCSSPKQVNSRNLHLAKRLYIDFYQACYRLSQKIWQSPPLQLYDGFCNNFAFLAAPWLSKLHSLTVPSKPWAINFKCRSSNTRPFSRKLICRFKPQKRCPENHRKRRKLKPWQNSSWPIPFVFQTSLFQGSRCRHQLCNLAKKREKTMKCWGQW